MKKTIANPESGNVFLFVFLGVVLFATLAFTISRGMRSDTAIAMSDREVELAASDIMSYAQRLERGVSRLRRRSVSESDISFHVANWGHTDYQHGQPDKNQIFHPSGGAVSWKEAPQGSNDGSVWHFTGSTCIGDIGTGAAGCESDADATNEELIAVLPGLVQSICQEINDKLEITGIPANTGTGYSTTEFVGTYADGTIPDNMDGFNAGCFDGGASQTGFHFYHVLIAR